MLSEDGAETVALATAEAPVPLGCMADVRCAACFRLIAGGKKTVDGTIGCW